jgi:hypothetical protein
MLVHNNLFTPHEIQKFIHKLSKENEKREKNLQTNMLRTYGLGYCVN